MTFPMNKRIGNEQFIERTAAHFIGETQIMVVTNEGEQ